MSKETAISRAKSLLSCNDVGQISFEGKKFSELFEDTQYRILAGIISWFSGSFYKPRFSQLENMHKKIIENRNLSGATLGGTVFRKKNGIVTVVRELASVEESHLIKNKKFIWDNRWLITFKSGVQSGSYIKPFGLLTFDDHKFNIDGNFDKVALTTIPIIIKNKSVKFVPLSNLKYNVEVKLLNADKEFYKFF